MATGLLRDYDIRAQQRRARAADAAARRRRRTRTREAARLRRLRRGQPTLRPLERCRFVSAMRAPGSWYVLRGTRLSMRSTKGHAKARVVSVQVLIWVRDQRLEAGA